MISSHLKVRGDWFLRNTAFGLTIGACSAFALAYILDSNVSSGLKEFYTYIISALLTLIAAALTLVGVFATIAHQRELEQRARFKKLEAARAFLPNALSRMCELSDYAILYSHNFDDFMSRLGEDEFRDISSSRLTLTDEIISILRDVIELTDDDKLSRRLSGLLREHQVFLARWRSLFSSDRDSFIQTTEDVRQRTVSWAYLGAISASLFTYARGESLTVDTTVGQDEIASILGTSGATSLDVEEHMGDIGLYQRTFARRFESD